MQPSTLAKLSQHPKIVGCKLSHGNVALVTQVTLNPAVDMKNFHVYTGLGSILVPLLSIGASGCVDGTAGWFPKSLVRLYDLALKSTVSQLSPEELELRKKLSYGIAAQHEIVVKFGVPGIKEATSRVRGFGKVGSLRLLRKGGIDGGDAGWATWSPIMQAMEDIEKTL